MESEEALLPGRSHADPIDRTETPATDVTEHLPVTAIIASRNEATLLEQRLAELAGCDEIIVIDLESSDRTAAVATAAGARVVPHPLVPIAELARVAVAKQARNDWLLLVDPDEEIPSTLMDASAAFLREPPPDDVGVAYAPWIFLFRGRPLRGTVWGVGGHKPFLVRRDAVELATSVHTILSLRTGFRHVILDPGPGNPIRHHWVSGYRDWLRKHRRYLRLEGSSRADKGLVTGYRRLLRLPWTSFKECFLARRGYLDGGRGLLLSLLWAWYSTAAELALLRELERRRRSTRLVEP
jgi:glycosyltransferase involved in cell wall biosynthesis